MLRGIDPILSPDLLQILRAMGHGDHIVIADANFPASSMASKLIRADGSDATQLLSAIVNLMPLDSFVPDPVICMQVVGAPDEIPPIIKQFQTIIEQLADHPARITQVERFEFYQRAREAFAIVQTGERRLYGNIILTKGVLSPDTADDDDEN